MFHRQIGLMILLLTVILANMAGAVDKYPYDRELAVKYELTILSENEKPAPAPQWLQNADMCICYGSLWKGFDIDLKDVAVEFGTFEHL